MTSRHGMKVTGWMIAALVLTIGFSAVAADDAPAPVPVPAETDSAAAPAAKDGEPALAARIADRAVITKEEFDTQYDTMRMRMQGHGGLSPKRLLDSMIDSKLIYILAVDSGLKASNEDVEDQVKRMTDRVKAANMDLDTVLKSEGLTMETLKEKIGEGIVQQKYVENQLKDVKVSEEELTTRYNEMKDAGRLERDEDTVDVSHILIRVPEGSGEDVWAGAKKRIDEARKRVVDGETFGDVAKELSEDPGSKERGGSYKEIGASTQFVQEFKDTAFALDVGGLSEPFKTQHGWHILTVDAKHPTGTLELQEVREILEEQMNKEKQREVIDKVIADAREKYPVEILVELKEPAPPQMPQLTMPPAATPAPAEGSS